MRLWVLTQGGERGQSSQVVWVSSEPLVHSYIFICILTNVPVVVSKACCAGLMLWAAAWCEGRRRARMMTCTFIQAEETSEPVEPEETLSKCQVFAPFLDVKNSKYLPDKLWVATMNCCIKGEEIDSLTKWLYSCFYKTHGSKTKVLYIQTFSIFVSFSSLFFCFFLTVLLFSQWDADQPTSR